MAGRNQTGVKTPTRGTRKGYRQLSTEKDSFLTMMAGGPKDVAREFYGAYRSVRTGSVKPYREALYRRGSTAPVAPKRKKKQSPLAQRAKKVGTLRLAPSR